MPRRSANRSGYSWATGNETTPRKRSLSIPPHSTTLSPSGYSTVPLRSSPYRYPTKSKEDKYPYKYPNNKSSLVEKEKKRALERKLSSGWRKLLIKVLLAVFTAVNCIFLYFIVLKALETQLNAKSIWRMHPQPKVVRAENMLIASSSETCNEMARAILSRDRSTGFATIVMMMALCVSVAEPHNSGLVGQGLTIFVDAKKKTCKQTQGHYILSSYLDMIEQAIVEDPSAAHIGHYTFAPPRHAANLLGILYLSNETTRLVKELDFSLKVFSQVMGPKLPMSRSLANAAAAAGEGAFFSYFDVFRFFRKRDFTLKNQGELFDADATHVKMVGLLVDLAKRGAMNPVVMATNMMSRKIMGMLKFLEQDGWAGDLEKESKLWELTVNNTQLIDGKITKLNGYSVCSANLPSSSSFVVDALKKHEKEFKAARRMRKDIMYRQEFYKLMFRTVMDAVERFKDWRKITGFGIDKESAATIEHLSKAKKRRRQKKSKTLSLATHGANMLVVIDVKKQKAVSMVNSLGSSLGSLVTDSQKYIYNNLLSDLGEDLDHIGPVLNSLQPIIAFKKGKISLAMAGCGGVLTRSLDLARTIATAALRLFFNVPIEEAISVPLVYPKAEQVEYTPGFPWPELGKLSQYLRHAFPNLKPPRSKKADELHEALDRAVVASSDRKEAKGFFYDSGKSRMRASAV